MCACSAWIVGTLPRGMRDRHPQLRPSEGRQSPTPVDSGADAAALADRLQRLQIILPAIAQETATARREAARLREENAELRCRIAELEAAAAPAPRA
jgi:hypothetical protein